MAMWVLTFQNCVSPNPGIKNLDPTGNLFLVIQYRLVPFKPNKYGMTDRNSGEKRHKYIFYI